MTSFNERYEFQPPTNIVAIRSSIMTRLKQRNEIKSAASSVTSSPSPLTPPSHHDSNDYENKLSFLHLDNGLPSPPIETCFFEEQEKKLPTEMVVNALLELSQEKQQQQNFESSEIIRERIRLLKEEKHKLFQVMKDLLSKPSLQVTMATTTKQAVEVKRSRSISHTEDKPISRYYNRSLPSAAAAAASSSNSRLYNSNSYYPYSLNTVRRVINNTSSSSSPSSFVSSRPQQLAVRSSSSLGSFRRPDSRY